MLVVNRGVGRHFCPFFIGDLFANLNEARQIIEEWKIDYNTNRPPSSLNGFTPTEFATRPNGAPNQKIPGPAGVVLGSTSTTNR